MPDDRNDTAGHAEDAPPGIDVTTPSPARIYDVFLGGKDNYAADRAAAEIATKAGPDVPRAARENRAFLRRFVHLAVGAGIRQFIDLGTGLPTQGNVHEVAQSLAPESRVVYVDNDPIVLSHARALLPPSKTTAVIKADIREPETILGDQATRDLIDLTRPVAVLMLAVLHFASDDEVRHTLAAFHAAMAPGSLLAISHSTVEGHPDTGEQVASAWKNSTSPIQSRDRKEVEVLFNGFDLLDPGVVWVPEWRPTPGDRGDGTRWMYAGVARRP